MKLQTILMLIYRMLKYSGFLLISLSFSSSAKIEAQWKLCDIVFFTLSFIISFIGNFNVGFLPLDHIIKSMLMQVGSNLLGRITVLAIFMIKVSNMVFGRYFVEIMKNLQFIHEKVKGGKIFYEILIAQLTFSAAASQSRIIVETTESCNFINRHCANFVCFHFVIRPWNHL